MRDIVLAWVVTGVLFVGTILIGRALVKLLRIGFLSRWTPENIISAGFLGTAMIILPFGYCSYLGMSAFPAALVVLTLVAFVFLSRMVFRPWTGYPSRSRWNRLLVVGIPIALGIVLCLLPVCLGDCYVFHNDTYFYDSVAEWLQYNGMKQEHSNDPTRPHWIFVQTVQATGHRMGPMFLLAMVESLCPNTRAIEVFESVTAWGMVLNLGGVYLLCRWSFRCSQRVALFAMFLAAGLNPLWLSSSNGFLCQIYGTGTLAFSLAILTRLMTRSRWTFGTAIVLATAAALLTSVYNELMPILTGASMAWIITCRLRDARIATVRRLAFFSICSAMCYLLIANIEVLRAMRAIWVMANLNGVGAHIDWSAWQYMAFAFGAKPFSSTNQLPLSAGTLALLSVATTLFAVGFIRSVQSYRTWPILTSLILFAGLVVYFRWFARDPWSHAYGHTWNQFKLCKWAFIFVVVLQAAGINTLSLKLPRFHIVILPALCMLFLVIDIWRGYRDVKNTINHYHRFYNSRQPLASFRSIRDDIDRINPSSIYLFTNGNDPLHNNIIPYILNPRPFCNPWPRESFPEDPPHIKSPLPTSVIGLMYGDPPFDKPQRHLDCGLSLIDLQRPFIAHVDNNTTLHNGPNGRPELGIGQKETLIDLWSPRAGKAELSFDSHPGPGLLASQSLFLHLIVEGETHRELTVECPGPASIPIDAHAGITHIRIFCTNGLSIVGPVEDSSVLAYLSHCQFSNSRPPLSVTKNEQAK